jgi:hypothetical protein
MSDVGLKASQYQRSSALATKVELLVDQISIDSVAAAQTRLQLAQLLDGVSDLLRPLAVTHINAADALSLPPGTLRRLRRQSIDGEPLPAVLDRTVARLRNTDCPVDEQDVTVLQTVARCAQRDAADAFARVIRR